ncbi:hypothetical protein BRADI_2g07986v3 [Brachypodium distachyon]|uniref:TF-B3 domain-containing protein n=1 Tax=Brachypodium distachyon TaxID=15368 RepID=A0A0Q3FYM7_BRADI|nr:hypothetical protein BRADI_2g07986v3 [Brachypodium distachyon]
MASTSTVAMQIDQPLKASTVLSSKFSCPSICSFPNFATKGFLHSNHPELEQILFSRLPWLVIFFFQRKRGKPAGRTGNHPSAAKSEMEQKMPLVTVEKELSIVADQQSIIINCDDKDDEEYVLLNDKEHAIVVDQPPIILIKDTDDEKENVPLNNKRVRPAASKSAKSNKEQKKTLLKLKLALIESGGHGSNSSERDNDAHPVPMVFDVDGQQTCASVQGNCGSAMKSAKEVQVKLPGEQPSFVKRMLQSHVSQGFSLGLPCDFCNKHLPKHDTVIVLEDEDGCSYDTKYLGTKKGLGAGWRDFAISHGVKVGDVLDFQLVNSTKFKVYISRANNFTSTDGALSILSLDAGKEVPEEERSDGTKSKENAKVTTVSSKKTLDDGNDLVGESIIGIKLLDSDINFDDVTCFSNFNIVVDSLVIDCKFTDRLRKMYYELCSAQKSFLHKNLLKKKISHLL